MYEITGAMYAKKNTNQVTDKFSKREFIIVTQDQYPQHIALQCVNDKCILLNEIGKGDLVKVTFNLNGKRFTNKQGEEVVFNNLNVYKIDVLQKGTIQPPAKQTQPPPADFPSDTDDLPF